MGGQFSPRIQPSLGREGWILASNIFGFYFRVSDPFLGSKKIITWFFNQVFEERISVFILGPWIHPSGQRRILLGFSTKSLKRGSQFLSSARFYPRVKESDYLVFQPCLEERILVFILGSQIQPLYIEDNLFLSSGQFYSRVKEGDYLVFRPSLEERVSVFVLGF
jgi:hypothetical protein